MGPFHACTEDDIAEDEFCPACLGGKPGDCLILGQNVDEDCWPIEDMAE